MQNLTIATLQTDLTWENPTANFSHITEQLAAVEAPFDLLVLPEMFSTGFTMNAAAMAEPWEYSKSIEFLQTLSLKHNASVVASIPILEGGTHFNRAVFIENGRVKAHYDKRKLFSFAGEGLAYSPGAKKCIVDCYGWKVNLQICFDLRFPEMARNTYAEGIGYEQDITIYVANWPASRIEHWNTLLKARAIENQTYVIGVNRIGKDAKEIVYSGATKVIHPNGEVLSEAKDNQTELCITELNHAELFTYRERFPFLRG